MIRTLLSSTLVAIMAAAVPATAQVYRWVDDRGVVNYTNVAPPSGVQVTRLEANDPRISALPVPSSRLPTLPPLPPPAASAPPGEVDRATVAAVGHALAARSRNLRHAAAGKPSADGSPALLSELLSP
jgi:Domain of unknown function (DUF4124)